jgi:hypothetical protein
MLTIRVEAEGSAHRQHTEVILSIYTRYYICALMYVYLKLTFVYGLTIQRNTAFQKRWLASTLLAQSSYKLTRIPVVCFVSFKCHVTEVTDDISWHKHKLCSIQHNRFRLWTPHLNKVKVITRLLISCLVRTFNLERRSKCHDYE